MRLSILVISMLLASAMPGQQLLNSPKLEPEIMPWNEVFIKRNLVQSIEGRLSVKREGMPIIKKPQKYLYRFDNHGQIVYRNTSYGNPGNGIDTTFTIYEYESSRLTRQLTTDIGGHFERTFSYDSLDRMTTQTYARVQNLENNRYTFKPGERNEISDERYTYSVSGTKTEMTFLNDQGLPFKERLFEYNDLGYLIRIEDLLLMSRKRNSQEFTYDDKGRLSNRIRIDQKGQRHRVSYEYDSVNNLLKREFFLGDKKLKFEEYLYDLETGLLDARLTKDLATSIITIVQYDYTFY